MISNALSDLQGRTNSIKQGIAVTTDFFYGRRSSNALLFCVNKKNWKFFFMTERDTLHSSVPSELLFIVQGLLIQ